MNDIIDDVYVKIGGSRHELDCDTENAKNKGAIIHESALIPKLPDTKVGPGQPFQDEKL